MKLIHFKTLTMVILSLFVTTTIMGQESIHAFKKAGLTGETIDFSSFKGKKILIVNTASECGFTPQYEQLQELHTKHGDKLVIVGFPANNFGKQEPGSNDEIHTFCKKNYGVSFPMAAKVSVKGEDIDDLFVWLNQQENDDFTGDIRWNFEKYLLDENGKLMRRFRSKKSPMDQEIIDLL